MELKTLLKYDIKGRGLVFIVSLKANPTVGIAIGRKVTVDGLQYIVTGVELSEKNGEVQDEIGVVVRPYIPDIVITLREANQSDHVLFQVDRRGQQYPSVSLLMPRDMAELFKSAVEEKQEREIVK